MFRTEQQSPQHTRQKAEYDPNTQPPKNLKSQNYISDPYKKIKEDKDKTNPSTIQSYTPHHTQKT